MASAIASPKALESAYGHRAAQNDGQESLEPTPEVKHIGVDIIPARDLGNVRRWTLRLLDQARLSAFAHRRRRSGPERTVTVISFAH